MVNFVRTSAIAIAGLAGLAGGCIEARAQNLTAPVVAACGTPPQTYTAGSTFPVTQDTTGKLCANSSGGGAGGVTIGSPVTGGTPGDDLVIDSSGNVGQIGNTGTGLNVLQTSPTILGTMTLGTLPITGSTNTIKFGIDSATPQGLSIDVSAPLAGNANVAGAKITVFGGRTTGNGAPGALDFQLGGIGTVGGTTVNGFFDAMTLTSPSNGQALLSILAGAVSINGATPGSNALAVTGVGSFSGNLMSASLELLSNSFTVNSTSLALGSAEILGWSSTASALGTIDTQINRIAAATFGFGGPDAAVPVAQTLQFQGVATGTANTAGPLTKFNLAASTGTGSGGGLEILASVAGGSGSTPNARVNVLDYNLTNANSWTFSKPVLVAGTVFSTSLISSSSSLQAPQLILPVTTAPTPASGQANLYTVRGTSGAGFCSLVYQTATTTQVIAANIAGTGC